MGAPVSSYYLSSRLQLVRVFQYPVEPWGSQILYLGARGIDTVVDFLYSFVLQSLPRLNEHQTEC